MYPRQRITYALPAPGAAALRPNLRPVMPRAGARVPPGPKFGKAGTLRDMLSSESMP